jgi:hypothetical protein
MISSEQWAALALYAGGAFLLILPMAVPWKPTPPRKPAVFNVTDFK